MCSMIGEIENAEIEIKLVQLEDEVIGVEFYKKKGETCEFYETTKKIKEKLGELRNKD